MSIFQVEPVAGTSKYYISFIHSKRTRTEEQKWLNSGTYCTWKQVNTAALPHTKVSRN